MKKLFCVFLITINVFASKAFAETYVNFCVSPSGQSNYSIDLDTSSKSGEIAYKFIGQHIIYKATITEVSNSFFKPYIKGVGRFDYSRTGQEHSNPFEFIYYTRNKTFRADGLEYTCHQ